MGSFNWNTFSLVLNRGVWQGVTVELSNRGPWTAGGGGGEIYTLLLLISWLVWSCVVKGPPSWFCDRGPALKQNMYVVFPSIKLIPHLTLTAGDRCSFVAWKTWHSVNSSFVFSQEFQVTQSGWMMTDFSLESKWSAEVWLDWTLHDTFRREEMI